MKRFVFCSKLKTESSTCMKRFVGVDSKMRPQKSPECLNTNKVQKILSFLWESPTFLQAPSGCVQKCELVMLYNCTLVSCWRVTSSQPQENPLITRSDFPCSLAHEWQKDVDAFWGLPGQLFTVSIAACCGLLPSTMMDVNPAPNFADQLPTIVPTTLEPT